VKNDINQVAQTIAQTIEKFPANTAADHGGLHHTLGYTKRQSEAKLMATYFLKKIEKMNPDKDEESKAEYDKYHNQLVDKALEISGK
jgi:hypothetical protein